ncbi:type VI secretion system Vgr family protein [Marinobacter sp. C2H3]|uniref:type VI secretion system Vgr family protein n=1 Tax=Marinobacter sp. C2H3 TaxID=3119003 RepID=UPI00300F4057
MPQPNGLQFTARIADYPADHFAVVGFSLTEGLSQLVEGHLDLASTDLGVSAEQMLDQPVDLVIWQDGEPLRRFTGIVTEMAQDGIGNRLARYQVVFRPPLWRLSLMHNSRIFQAQSPEAIVRTLLDERGLVGVTFHYRRTPETREYAVQHRETDLAFVERLAAEEGWHYRYQHGSVDGTEPPALVFADHYGDAPSLAPVTVGPRSGPGIRAPRAYRFETIERVAVASVVTADYTFKNPANTLTEAAHAADLPHRDDYEIFDYPGRYKAGVSGRAFTQAALDARRCQASVAEGESHRCDLVPGARFAMEGHRDAAMNRDWRLVAVTHVGEQPQALEEGATDGATRYHNRFEVMPADRPWRPVVPARPTMDGPQMAVVTGPAGEDIHCDGHGRVKVRFPWDRYAGNDEHSSAWLRVSQAWAGGQYGVMALPRVGHEVIVSFLDGDPDQPIITGRTYHAVNTAPYPLPEHKTRTLLRTHTHKGEGSNELRFEDAAGAEHVFLQAWKDLDLVTGKNHTEVVGQDSHRAVARDALSHIQGDEHQTTDGHVRQHVGGDVSQSVGGTLHQRTGDRYASEAGSDLHHRAGDSLILDAGAELTLAGGGSFITLDAGGVTLSGPAIRINSGGSAGSGGGTSVSTPTLPTSPAAK